MNRCTLADAGYVSGVAQSNEDTCTESGDGIILICFSFHSCHGKVSDSQRCRMERIVIHVPLRGKREHMKRALHQLHMSSKYGGLYRGITGKSMLAGGAAVCAFVLIPTACLA